MPRLTDRLGDFPLYVSNNRGSSSSYNSVMRYLDEQRRDRTIRWPYLPNIDYSYPLDRWTGRDVITGNNFDVRSPTEYAAMVVEWRRQLERGIARPSYSAVYDQKFSPYDENPYYAYTITNESDDMFASRKEGDTYKLCVRRGRIIDRMWDGNILKKIEFPSYAVAKQCSDELNEKCFAEYSSYVDRDNSPLSHTPVPNALKAKMIEVIGRYAVLTEVSDTDTDGSPNNQATSA